MDDRSWLWRHKSPEKSPGETESSGSASSHSDRYSDGQESLRTSPNDISASHVQASEVAPDTCDSDIHETVKRLTEKLSAALLNICAKEDLVKQHAKVAEEAVSGWEQAEAEVAALKQQLETAIQRNTYLEDKIGQLDSALKGCANPVEQDEKVHDSITKKAHERESEKHEVEEHLVEAKAQLEAAKTQNTTLDHGLEARLEAVERENMVLKSELHSQSEELQVLLLERELSNKAAETASKQHLESIKKVTKLEAECRQLKNINRRLSSASDHKQIASPACLESLTDSQSDSGERLLGIDNELGCSDSWATALIAELDQFKNEKPHLRNLTTSVEIELMDDFLEMERFVALPETESSGFEPEARPDQVTITDSLPKIKTENLNLKLIELEEKLERLEHERSELEIALVESRNHLGMSCNMLTAAEIKIADLQKRADLADESKTSEIMDLEGRKKVLETQLELAYSDIGKLSEKVSSLLEENYEANIVSSIELKAKLEMAESAIKASDSQLNSANLEVRSLNEAVGTLERKVKEERTLSSELAAKVEASEATKEALESQLRQAYSEITKLKEKVSFLELKAEEERILSAEFAAKLETSEAAKKKLELDFKLAHEFATKIDAAETANKLLEIQLESAEVEIRKLSNNIAFLEEKVDEERALSAEYAAKCHKMESDLLKFDRETDFQRVAHSKQELKIKQGKELAVAAGKLEECQKTIASLNQQLKSLTTMDDLMLEVEMPQHEVGEQGFHHSDDSESELIDTYTFQNGGEKGSLLSSSVSLRSSSSSSNLSQLMRTLSHSRSTTC